MRNSRRQHCGLGCLRQNVVLRVGFRLNDDYKAKAKTLFFVSFLGIGYKRNYNMNLQGLTRTKKKFYLALFFSNFALLE